MKRIRYQELPPKRLREDLNRRDETIEMRKKKINIARYVISPAENKVQILQDNIRKTERNEQIWLQTTQPTSGGAVTADSSCCANCVEPPRSQQWGPIYRCLGMPDPLVVWRCCSQKRMMSSPCQMFCSAWMSCLEEVYTCLQW